MTQPCIRTSMSHPLPTPGMVEMLRIDTGVPATKPAKTGLQTRLLHSDFEKEDGMGDPDKSDWCGLNTKVPSESYRLIYIANMITVVLHLIMLVASSITVSTRTPRLYNLKVDRVQVVPAPTGNGGLFEGLPQIRQLAARLSGGVYNHSVDMFLAEQLLKAKAAEKLGAAGDDMAGIEEDIRTIVSGTDQLLTEKIVNAYENTVNTSFLQIRSPYTADWRTWHDKSNESLSETCHLAHPNTLEFSGTIIPNIRMQMWVYPKNAYLQFNLGWLVVTFFGLSALFQMPFAIFSWESVGSAPFLRYFSYKYIFGASLTDYDKRSAKDYNDNHPTLLEFERVCMREMRFNWLRFVEYSISGSLVQLSVALTAGIVDAELIACMFTMSATCMLLGIVADALWRGRNVLIFVRNLLVVNPKENSEDKHPLLFRSESKDKSKASNSTGDSVIDSILNSKPELEAEKVDLRISAADGITGQCLKALDAMFTRYLEANTEWSRNPEIDTETKKTLLEQKRDWQEALNNVGTIQINWPVYQAIIADMQSKILPDATMKIIVKWINAIAKTMLMGFWLTHLLAWVCIAPPWIIITQHFLAYWNPCDAPSLSTKDIVKFFGDNSTDYKMYDRKWEPPEPVRVVVWFELALFVIFGIVQALMPLRSIKHVWGFSDTYRLQINGTNNYNKFTEVSYVFLSMFAKWLLGGTLLANVIL